jgi:hypothetical protein
LVRAKLDAIREMLAYPRRRHWSRGLGLLLRVPQADGNARAVTDVGESVADEPGLRPEGGQHAILGLFSQLGEGALEHLVVRDAHCLHRRVLLRSVT